MKKSASSYELSTTTKDVTVLMPEKAEVLGLHQGRYGLLIDALVPRGDASWVEWRFQWQSGEQVEGLSSENYVGSVPVGPGGKWWHLFFVE